MNCTAEVVVGTGSACFRELAFLGTLSQHPGPDNSVRQIDRRPKPLHVGLSYNEIGLARFKLRKSPLVLVF